MSLKLPFLFIIHQGTLTLLILAVCRTCITMNLRPGHMVQNYHSTQNWCTQHSCNCCRSRIGSYFCNIMRNCLTVCPSSATMRATSSCNVARNDARPCVHTFSKYDLAHHESPSSEHVSLVYGRVRL